MPQASRKFCTLALLLWAASVRGKSSCIIHLWCVRVCVRQGEGAGRW